MTRSAFLGMLALIGVAALGSIMGVFARELSADLNVPEQVALRSALGALVLYVLMFRQIDLAKMRAAPRADLGLVAMRAISMYVISISLATVAFLNGKYSAVGLVMALPVPAILGALFFSDRLTARHILTIALASAGAGITILANTVVSFELGWPLLAGLGASIFMSLGILAQKRASGYFNTYETTFLMLLVGALGMAVFALMGWLGGSPLPVPSLWSWGVALVAGIANIFFLLGSIYGAPRVHAVVLNNAMALQPVFAALVGALLYANSFTGLELLGAALIMLSIATLKR